MLVSNFFFSGNKQRKDCCKGKVSEQRSQTKISIVVKSKFQKPVGLQGKPPFLSYFVRVLFQSPPIMSVVNSDFSIR